MPRRHNWPRKNEEMRLYRERNGAHTVVIVDDVQGNTYGAVCNVYEGADPSLVYGSVSKEWLLTAGVSRVQWSEVPKVWQDAITEYMTRHTDDEPPFVPEKIRGFWTVGNQPVVC